MSTVQIKSIWGTVLFECDVPLDATERTRAALIAACQIRANLSGAYLRGANLSGAYLRGAYLTDANLTDADLRDANLSGANLSGAYLTDANLTDADLRGANLTDAYLRGANLSGAYLRGANLSGAYLRGANLSGAYLRGAKLSADDTAIEGDCVLQLGPIGSRDDYVLICRTNNGLRVVTGCFYGSDIAFLDAVTKTHANNKHARNYRAAIEFARIRLGDDDA